LRTLDKIESLDDSETKKRLKHTLLDHYLQRALLPHETEMRTWMRGAAAVVNHQKIHFRDIIPWCQKSSSYEDRQRLQSETGPLCKFLKPFALNYWNIFLEILNNELGFDSYIDYCTQKKGIDYRFYYNLIKELLSSTDDLYFEAMNRWCRRSLGLPMEALTRFDAIYMLGLGEFDGLLPKRSKKTLLSFFLHWNIDPENTPGLHLALKEDRKKSSQAISFILRVPEEIYILMNPEGGWIDLETLWHELGHGLSAAFTSPELSITERCLATSYGLSEAYAFLFQNLVMSRPFLKNHLGLSEAAVDEVCYYKGLKDLSVFRRYAAKFIAEVDMFSNGNLSDGQPYADLMARTTGFSHQPESHLFDLVPELYSLDYLLGWIGEAIMNAYLTKEVGGDWLFSSETGKHLKNWWAQGHRLDMPGFFIENDLGALSPAPLLDQLQKKLNKSCKLIIPQPPFHKTLLV